MTSQGTPHTELRPLRKPLGRKQKRLLVIAGLGAVAAIALTLIFFALGDQIVYFYTPSEALAHNVAPGKAIRLGGLVKDGSWKKDGDVNTFVMSDGKGQIGVKFVGILPDLFREGQGVVAEGAIGSGGTFLATNVLAKHNATYIPKQLEIELKKRGEWRPDDPQAALKGG